MGRKLSLGLYLCDHSHFQLYILDFTCCTLYCYGYILPIARSNWALAILKSLSAP
jgi:hypothetical protein